MFSYKTLYSYTQELSILIAEDYKPLRNDMKDILGTLFKFVIAVEDGAKALEYYNKYYAENGINIDIILSDLEMPIMDGISLTQELKKLNPNQEIIILSAFTQSKYLLPLINLGIARFITKPLIEDELFDTLLKVSQDILVRYNNREIVDLNILSLKDNFTWNQKTMLLKDIDHNINLTRHELVLMQLLINKREIISSEELIIEYFDYNDIHITAKNIRNLIFKLRKKLPKESISSLYGLGYKINLAN